MEKIIVFFGLFAIGIVSGIFGALLGSVFVKFVLTPLLGG